MIEAGVDSGASAMVGSSGGTDTRQALGRAAEELATRLDTLLEAVQTAGPEHRAAIVGAARYFVSAHDDVPDEQEGGLDDDVDVFNHVARLVGRPDIVIVRAG